MNLEEFIEHFAEQFEETDASLIKADTKFKDLDEWSSLLALCVISMVDEEYGVMVKGNELLATDTVEDLFKLVSSKKA